MRDVNSILKIQIPLTRDCRNFSLDVFMHPYTMLALKAGNTLHCGF
jgi:hypothetical protein